ncbi:Plasmodium exported protein, unknown function [Plasmodium malariae]|uniref:Fam-b protein n=1 Tax=Plasmodium malariae TaxID=5858 RepID=A0A1D3JHV8_PLAMA|nr:Plasmodium exported protein, unknown function [Plasmodium malariae]XP_028859238.1 Plasmodium exported protein, unknown function [Plasmodium malariae]SBT85524.1 Plasmodium exported protein, unknown function [Plasmodium malariae]SBT85991.1 Plasmodium exported protein, unknown function [Plasmodium malariae]
MIIFFIRAFIFSCLIWIFKYSDESNICDKTRNKKLNINNILNIKYSRLLSSEIRAFLEDKHKCLKEKIYDLKGKSTASFEKKPYALKQYNFFQEEDNESIYNDTYQEELNYFMPRKKPQNLGDFNVKHNLKEKSFTVKHYNNIQNNKNLHKSSKKLYSENDSSSDLINSSNKRNCNIIKDKINDILNIQ